MRSKVGLWFILGALLFSFQSNPQAANASTVFDVNVTDHQPLSGILGSGTSYIATQLKFGLGALGAQNLCTGLDDPKCAQDAEIYSMLPVCESASEINCIESLAITSEGSVGGAATHRKTIGKLAFEADPSIGLPAGSNISLWSVAGLTSAGRVGDFAVTVRVKLYKNGSNLTAQGFSARVEPFTTSTTSSEPVKTVERTNPMGIVGISGEGGDRGCIWIDSGQCGVVQDFPKDSRVKLTIRIGNYLTSWLHGRFTDPSITITAIDAKNNRLEMEAAPVKVPSATALVNADEAADSVKNKFRDPSGYLPPGNIGMYVEATERGAMQTFKDFEKNFSQKSNKLVDTWSMRSLSAPLSPCAARVASTLKAPLATLIGVVATNSITYDSGPPAFSNGTLSYQVAGLRYLSDGSTIFQGRYDLLMRSQFARCLYNYTDAPVVAEVAITKEGDTEIVETTVLREDKEKTWLMLGAYGFTFSSPTLQVRLKQEKAVAPSPSPSPSASSSPSPSPSASPGAATKVTITCAKGKAVKKVTAEKPKCPKGFKKR